MEQIGAIERRKKRVFGNGTTDDIDPMERFVCFQNLEEDILVHLLVPGNVEPLERAQVPQDARSCWPSKGSPERLTTASGHRLIFEPSYNLFGGGEALIFMKPTDQR
jgi:hypothetical protein